MESLQAYLGTFSWWHAISSFIFMIAIIDPIGNMPVTISMEEKGTKIHPMRVCIYSLIILCAFLVLGDIALRIFGIRIEYFAVAGGFVILLMAMEMLLDIEIFKSNDLGGSGDLVPLAFPLYAGPGSFTALISLTTDYSMISLLVAILLCMIALYIVLKTTHWVTKYMKPVSLFIVRKFFGVIVLAIAMQLMFANLLKVFRPELVRDSAPTQMPEIIETPHADIPTNTVDSTAMWN